MEVGGGRAAGELLTTWMHYPNVPYFQQKAEASSWDGNVSMASAHRHISASAMSLVARVLLSPHLLTPEESPLEVPGQEPGPLSPNMTPRPTRHPSPLGFCHAHSHVLQHPSKEGTTEPPTWREIGRVGGRSHPDQEQDPSKRQRVQGTWLLSSHDVLDRGSGPCWPSGPPGLARERHRG